MGNKQSDDEDQFNIQHDAKLLWTPLSNEESSAERTLRGLKPTRRDEAYYNMNHTKRGFAVIFIHEDFDDVKIRRVGTQYDGRTLEKIFERLHFDVELYDDLTATQVLEVVQDLSERDHSRNDCFVMAVLSHGKADLIKARDNYYKVKKLWNAFTADKVPTLAGKPKLFIIQACQASKHDSGNTLNDTKTDGVHSAYKIPVDADFCIAFSTITGYCAWRNLQKGTWYIQLLCKELEENGFNKDLLTMLTAVNRRVAFNFEMKGSGFKQMPCFNSRLTRLVKFT